MKRIELTIPAAVLGLLFLPVSGATQPADELPPELLACAEETDVARRLECFDREMAKLSDTPEPEAPPAPEPVPEPAPEPVVVETAPEPVPEPAAEPAPAATAALDREVATSPSATASAPAAAATAAAATVAESTPAPAAEPVPTSAPEPETAEDFGLPEEGPREISATVTNIMKRPYGELVILLDNGQIWEQKHRDNRFRLNIGEEVTISDGLISGYRMTGGGRNNSIQVERLK